LSARDSYVVTALADITDRSLHAALARFTLGLSPAALAAAYLDWAAHLMAARQAPQLVDTRLGRLPHLYRLDVEAGRSPS
jgi:hypothetical protein